MSSLVIMSRIGYTPITIPSEVQVSLEANQITIKGPKGELTQAIPSSRLSLKLEDQQLIINRQGNDRQTKAYHGLLRSLVANMVEGVVNGYQKKLELVGTGYRVKKEADKLVLSLGFSPFETSMSSGKSTILGFKANFFILMISSGARDLRISFKCLIPSYGSTKAR